MMFIRYWAAVQTLLTCSALAVEWHFVSFVTPAGQKFIQSSGQLHVPPIPTKQNNYIWPGLQPTDNSGVYQNVLDQRSGTWWIGSGWCCSNPSLPWGSGFNTYHGDVISFNNTLGSKSWKSTLSKAGTSAVTNTFALTSKSFDDAVFAVELYGTWDFGPVTFSDVELIATGSNKAFCTNSPSNYNGATVVSITGATATISGNTVVCKIAKIVLERAA